MFGRRGASAAKVMAGAASAAKVPTILRILNNRRWSPGFLTITRVERCGPVCIGCPLLRPLIKGYRSSACLPLRDAKFKLKRGKESGTLSKVTVLRPTFLGVRDANRIMATVVDRSGVMVEHDWRVRGRCLLRLHLSRLTVETVGTVKIGKCFTQGTSAFPQSVLYKT